MAIRPNPAKNFSISLGVASMGIFFANSLCVSSGTDSAGSSEGSPSSAESSSSSNVFVFPLFEFNQKHYEYREPGGTQTPVKIKG